MSEPAAFTDLSGQKKGMGRVGTRLCREGQGRAGGCSAGHPRTVGLLRAVWHWEHSWPCSGRGSLASCGPNSDLHRAPAPWSILNSFFMENTESAQKSGGAMHPCAHCLWDHSSPTCFVNMHTLPSPALPTIGHPPCPLTPTPPDTLPSQRIPRPSRST